MKSDLKSSIIITGGIATGKSTVCKLLRDAGLKIVDADKIAHEVLDQNSKNIKEMFGSEYLNGYKVDRKALGSLVFKNKDELKRLEDLLHPQIREEILKEVNRYKEQGIRYVVDIPLFFETNQYNSDFVAVVYAPKELQIERLRLRDGLSIDEVEDRLKAQIPIEKKKDMADFIIDNSKEKEDLEKEVVRFLKEIDEIFKI